VAATPQIHRDNHIIPQVAVWAGVRVEALSIGWMIVEGAIGIGAGLIAHSVLLSAFGLDSVIELVTGATLFWRLLAEARGAALEQVERMERRAAWIVGLSLVLLCVYVVATSLLALVAGVHAQESPVGITLALCALVIMPLLARRKRRIARMLNSAALRGDAACSITCAYMAATLLAGLVLNAVFGWWWADSLMALALLWWLVPEAREALDGARAGHSACACDDCG
jgi:divalent metal cation (Fe/Co/Zn/Cd) transporter